MGAYEPILGLTNVASNHFAQSTPPEIVLLGQYTAV
jgi:hypothetical protein